MNKSTIAATAAAGVVAAQAIYAVAKGDAGLLRPPGTQGEADFQARCVRCGKCVEACPYGSIRLAGIEAGADAGTPYIDARGHACRLCEDFPCVEVCPTGALRDVEDRRDAHMGTPVIDEETCIAFEGMRCEVCYRACPLIDEAIKIDYRMREGDAIHVVFAPVIDEDVCPGCGLCVERCVVSDPEVPIKIVPRP